MPARPSPRSGSHPDDALAGHRAGDYRDHLPHHPQPPGHQPLRHQRASCSRRRRLRPARCRPSSRAWWPTATGCASCCRATRATTAAPVPDGERPRPGTSTRRCGPSPCRPTAKGRPAESRRHDPRLVPDSASARLPVPGGPDELAPGLVRLTAPNPGLMTGPGTNTYLVGSGRTGRDRPRPGRRGASRRPGRRGRRPRHASAGSWSPTPTSTTPPVPPPWPRPPGPGDRLRAGRGLRARRCVRARAGRASRGPTPASVTLRAVHTPGHASDHLCWLLRGESATRDRRPRHARLDRGHPPARRGPGHLPGQPGPGARPDARPSPPWPRGTVG